MTLQVIRGGVIVQSVALAQHTATMHVGSAARAAADGVASLDGSGDLPLAQVPDTLTGKDADTLDGSHAGNEANKIPILDGSGDLPLAQIPDTLTGKDADTLDGSHAGNEANKIPILDGSGDLPLAQVPDTLTGKDADTLDGSHAGNEANKIPILDGSGDLPLAQIPDTLTGKDADTLDGSHAGNEASKIPILDAYACLGPLQHYPAFERYTNHLGAVDNFTESHVTGNGAATEDATNHKMDLSAGTGAVGLARFHTKKSWTLSAKPIIVNMIVDNIGIGNTGSRALYAGLRANFTSSTSTISGCGLYRSGVAGSWRLFCANGSIWWYSDQAISNGDMVTIVATTSLVRFYVNGVYCDQVTSSYFPGGALYAGAGAIADASQAVDVTISLDFMDIIVAK